MRPRVKRLCALFVLFLVVGVLNLEGCTKNKEVYIYLVRHGQTYSNQQGKLVGGDGDYPLTEKGVDDAIALGKKLEDIDFQAVYSSSLGRAYNTANYILQGACQEKLSIEKIDALKDISWGDAEGYTVQEFMTAYGLEEFPNAFGNADDSEFESPIHAESKYDFCKRFESAILDIVAQNENKGGNVLVVAHSSMLFWLEKCFPDEKLGELENTSVTVLKYHSGDWELLEYNRID